MLVLLLNSTYEPLRIINWKRAVSLVYSGKVETIETYERILRSVSLSIPCPAVIRMKYYVKTIRKSIRPSRSLILQRDNYICQYCGKRLVFKTATLDHVKPKSRGGKYIWKNLVCSCYQCNNKKRNNLLEECGMSLLRTPVEVSWTSLLSSFSNNIEINKLWKKYV